MKSRVLIVLAGLLVSSLGFAGSRGGTEVQKALANSAGPQSYLSCDVQAGGQIGGWVEVTITATDGVDVGVKQSGRMPFIATNLNGTARGFFTVWGNQTYGGDWTVGTFTTANAVLSDAGKIHLQINPAWTGTANAPTITMSYNWHVTSPGLCTEE